jgi:hypothetical protein
MNDMSAVIIPKSDQINADDLLAGPMTITVEDVQIRGGQEQPVSIYFKGSDKAYRPCKSMSRVLVQAWGPDASKYIGRSLTLYRDEKVKWAGLEVGGIRISHMSDIDGEKLMMLTATKGSRKPHKIMPLLKRAGAPAADHTGLLADLELAAASGTEALQKAWQDIGAPARKALANELPRLKALATGPTDEPDPNTNDVHPGTAKADALIAEVDKLTSIRAIDELEQANRDDLEAMTSEDRIRFEVAAGNKKAAIDAAREQAPA